LQSQIHGWLGNLVGGFQGCEDLLATLATRDVSFQGRDLLCGERTLVIGGQRFRVGAFRMRDAFRSASAEMARERVFKASFAVVRRHSPLLC
jgi:hypothetical protein